MKEGDKKCVETITENPRTGEKTKNLQLSNLDKSNYFIQLFIKLYVTNKFQFFCLYIIQAS